jgi:hypothetical protein
VKKKIIIDAMGFFDFGDTEVTENIEVDTVSYIEIILVAAGTTMLTYGIARYVIKKCKKAIEKKIITTVPPV